MLLQGADGALFLTQNVLEFLIDRIHSGLISGSDEIRFLAGQNRKFSKNVPHLRFKLQASVAYFGIFRSQCLP